VQRAIRTTGYRHVGWNVSGIDWEPERSARDVAASVVGGALAHGDGTVVLLHTWPNQTLGALHAIVRRLRAGGATFVTVADLPPRSVPRRDVSTGGA
jgi:peptidoglycan/xylan/chitin deacetylase (PgdA/CDA1 family)